MAVGQSLIELREKSDEEPSCEEAAELIARLVESDGSRTEARERAYRFLNEEPNNYTVRLLLAKSFYLDRLGEFCVHELQEIRRRGGSSESLNKLLETFGAIAGDVVSSENYDEEEVSVDDDSEEQGVVAELDLDSDFTDALEELLDEDD